MSEERDITMQTETIPTETYDIALRIDQLVIKNESSDTNIIQLKGKLMRAHERSTHVVVALHTKNKAGEYIHLQQYEFEYALEHTLEKHIDISALVLSELTESDSYEVEIKLLTEQSNQQWETVQRYFVSI